VLVHQFHLYQLSHTLLQRPVVQGGHRLQQLIGKRAPNGRAQLRHGFHRGEAIEPRHERVLECRRDRQRRRRPGQRIARLPLLEEPGLQHHLGELFDEQRHAIGLRHDLFDDLGGQHPVVRHPADQLRNLWMR